MHAYIACMHAAVSCDCPVGYVLTGLRGYRHPSEYARGAHYAAVRRSIIIGDLRRYVRDSAIFTYAKYAAVL